MPILIAHTGPSYKSSKIGLQTHYGFIRSLNFKGIRTPYNFRSQFTIYSSEDKYLRKKEVETFLRSHYSSLGYSHVFITRTKKQYTLAGEFVKPSRTNFQRFLSFLRVIKPNNSFLVFEAFHTGKSFQSSTRHDSDEVPLFLSLNNDSEIIFSNIEAVKNSMNRISKIEVISKHRINNFYSFLEQSIRGPLNYRIIWFFIALESLFQLKDERGVTGERISKRISFYLESVDKKKRQDLYSVINEAYKVRGLLVHGGEVSNEKIRRSLNKLEIITWKLANSLLLSNSILKKRFTDEEELKKYFHWVNYKWGP